jgi:hypothetical protein
MIDALQADLEAWEAVSRGADFPKETEAAPRKTVSSKP